MDITDFYIIFVIVFWGFIAYCLYWAIKKMFGGDSMLEGYHRNLSRTYKPGRYDPELDPTTASYFLKQLKELKPLDRNSAIMRFGENLVYEKDKCVRCGRRYLKIEAGLCKLCKKKER